MTYSCQRVRRGCGLRGWRVRSAFMAPPFCQRLLHRSTSLRPAGQHGCTGRHRRLVTSITRGAGTGLGRRLDRQEVPRWRSRCRSVQSSTCGSPSPTSSGPGPLHRAARLPASIHRADTSAPTARTAPMGSVIRRVTFPSGGETLTGTLFTPPDPADGRLPAVVVAGGQTCVKEQMAGRYAERLAAHGYAALAFDFRGFGESTGEPRDDESPARKVEDLGNALTFLARRPDLDPGRLAALGIGVGAGYVAVAAADDPRLRALALVAPGLQDPEIVRARYGGAEGVAERVARGEAARRRYEQTGQVDYEPVVTPSDPPPLTDYFLNPDRGGVRQWSNRYAVMAYPEWLAFDPISAAS